VRAPGDRLQLRGSRPQASRPISRAEPEPTGWAGWILFGGIMMAMLGAFHAIRGLVALLQSDYYLVGPNGLTLNVDIAFLARAGFPSRSDHFRGRLSP
jgi:hypothetical protein